MRQVIKDMWVEALLSNTYTQTVARLRDDYGFDTFGVLCDVHSQATGTVWRRDRWDNGYTYMGQISKLPEPVQVFADLTDKQVRFVMCDSDSNASFEYLAKLIQKNL